MSPCLLALLLLGMPFGPIQAKDISSNPELKQIRDADQAVRQGDLSKLTPEQIQAMIREDRKRLERVRELLKEGKVVTATDFDYAALVFQHGETPDDYLTAHELAFLYLLKVKRGGSNLFAVSEDRFLESIGRRQRFNSQAGFGPNGQLIQRPVQTDGEAATDALRADLFQPTLEQYRKSGIAMTPEIIEALSGRAKERNDEKWLTEASKSPESQELKRLAEKPDVAAAKRALELYRADSLRTPDDYLNATLILIATATKESASDIRADRYLLAHELAAVAAIRGKKPEAIQAQAQALDKFLETIGFASRYGTTNKEPLRFAPATASVRTALGL